MDPSPHWQASGGLLWHVPRGGSEASNVGLIEFLMHICKELDLRQGSYLPEKCQTAFGSMLVKLRSSVGEFQVEL